VRPITQPEEQLSLDQNKTTMVTAEHVRMAVTQIFNTGEKYVRE
jgi:hypothetical protein